MVSKEGVQQQKGWESGSKASGWQAGRRAEESVVAEASCPGDWRVASIWAPGGAGSQLGCHVSPALRTLSHWGTG